jgi:hypothetical protein
MELGFSSCSEAVWRSRSRLLPQSPRHPGYQSEGPGAEPSRAIEFEYARKLSFFLHPRLLSGPVLGGPAGHATFRPRVEERVAG